ncbi:Putative uncharacterized protein [Taphrina deformans PYCC 5710]|uniref:PLD phosphodiesterase domain-containing protein n=1 Tax=Taphrina deformans (strain PYCC 5710 / ATCC 11124 / CBS 356.35 / IMI 108563 / JCM 9778 / NBRC 8474) TaxID=1097556 RepID=R4XA04_TAPDE|nr:Putative uncharacterized protein [Taphrina deformans PYCC 5710]|eukprot:CCG82352.1 Putative uncharacterized protein [Taphrina deformans PYCC 5710]
MPASSHRDFVFAHEGSGTVTKPSYEHESVPTSNLSALQNQLKINQQVYENQDQPAQSISVNERLNVQEHVEQTANDTETDDFHPYMFHPRHLPLPMALVNRQPHNLPGHNDVVNPQNNAWLAALKYAQRSVFIQSPVCNGSPMVKGIIDACIRGIVVTIYVGLGFNDFAEAIVPFQGGSNVDVLKKLQNQLRPHGDGILSNLRWHWYTAKDQVAPLRFEKQARNCHVKFMNVDDEVAIMGSGNQDTQSWFHSQEVNVMIDSQLLCKDWTAGFRRIQNTEQYGKVDHFAPGDGALVGGKQIPVKKGMGGLKRSAGGFL